MRWMTTLALLGLFAGCSSPPPAEDDIEKALNSMEKAVEANNPQPVLARLHSDFDLNRSGRSLSRSEAARLLRLTLKRHQNVSVVLTRVKVESEPSRPDRARAWFSAVVTSSSRSRFLPEDGELYRIESEWALADSQWKLLNVASQRTLDR
jgi:hypothetical protein